MTYHLHQRLAQRVDAWRADGYPVEGYPAIAEILEWSKDPGSNGLRYLRRPQFQALETYWYLRLIEGAPPIFDLYKRIYPPDENVAGLLESLGIPDAAFKAVNYRIDPLWDRIKTDDMFAHDFKLESLRETLTLDYPSYILALAMGAGKTIPIGAIIATEFAMALEYPNDPGAPFVQNALVFAPGKTIIESLRELAEIPYEKILPPRLHKGFAASVKLTFTRDGEKDVPVIRGSLFNLVVTNTEKIRIQKETIRKADLGNLFAPEREDEARTEIANLRQVGDTVTIEAIPEATDAYAAAVDLAARYRLDLWIIYDELRRVYGGEDIPLSHIDDLATQIEEQTRFYEIQEERVDVALALVKPDGFLKETDASGTEVYTAEIVYPKDREKYLKFIKDFSGRSAGELSFHYEPYNFDSTPEIDFLDKLLSVLGESRGSIDGVYFTGALTDPAKTDFFIEYKDDKEKWRRYTPDFIIRKKPRKGGRPGSGKVLIVEVKREYDRAHPVDGENGKKAMALRKWENLNPDRLQYQMIFTDTETVAADALGTVRQFVKERCT